MAKQKNLLFNFKNKKILVILPDWQKTYINKNISKVMSRLQGIGGDIILFCGKSPESWHFKQNFQQSKIIEGRTAENLLYQFGFFVYYLTKIRPHLILWTYGGYRENIVLAVLRALKIGPRYIIKTDSYIPEFKNIISKKDRIRLSLFFKIPAKFSEFIIVESENIQRQAELFYGPKQKFLRMPNGAPTKLFKSYQNQYQYEKTPIDAPYILFTGRIMRSKGVDLLIEAFAKIFQKVPKWKLVIVGPTVEEEYKKNCVEKIQSYGLSERVVFQGFSEGLDLYRWYYFADIYVLPSRDEGLANRLQEAMYFKNPVIAFDVGETKSMINKLCGILVPPNNTDIMAEEILKLCRSENLRKKMGSFGHKIVEENFDNDKLIDQLILQLNL